MHIYKAYVVLFTFVICSHKKYIFFSMFRIYELIPFKHNNFDDAVRICEAYGRHFGLEGRLAEPQTQEQATAIFAFKNQSSTSWLGAVDRATEGVWLFNSNGQLVQFNLLPRFRGSAPDGAQHENCLAFHVDGINDYGCQNTDRYICEFGPSGVAPPF